MRFKTERTKQNFGTSFHIKEFTDIWHRFIIIIIIIIIDVIIVAANATETTASNASNADFRTFAVYNPLRHNLSSAYPRLYWEELLIVLYILV